MSNCSCAGCVGMYADECADDLDRWERRSLEEMTDREIERLEDEITFDLETWVIQKEQQEAWKLRDYEHPAQLQFLRLVPDLARFLIERGWRKVA